MYRYALIGVLMLSSAAAMADGLSYSYIQASLADVDIDGESEGGFGVAGSAEIADTWHIFADYTTAEFSATGFGDLDVSLTEVGLGYHHSVSGTTDVFAELAYAKIDVDIADDSGFSIRVGVRHNISESFEIFGSLGNLDFDDVDYGTELGAGFWYNFSGNMAAGADVRFADDIDILSASFRLYFDK